MVVALVFFTEVVDAVLAVVLQVQVPARSEKGVGFRV